MKTKSAKKKGAGEFVPRAFIDAAREHRAIETKQHVAVWVCACAPCRCMKNAAPDLYAACAELVDADATGNLAALSRALDLARAALRKAEGGEP